MGAAVAKAEEMADEDRVAILESDMKRVFSDVGEIKGSVKALDGKVQVLDGKVEELDEKVQSLDIKVHVLDSRVQELDKKVQVLDRKVEALDDKIDVVRTEATKEFAAVRETIGGLRTEMIEKIGNLRIWVLITIAGSAASLVSMGISIASFVRGWKSP